MKLGKTAARHNLHSMRSGIVMALALAPLGTPPAASNDYTAAVKVPWQVFLNNSLGDCVCADTAHSLMLRTANVGPIVVPTDNEVLRLYEAVGGYNPSDPSTDQGCNETDMCNYLKTTGFLGHKADATGSIDPANLDHVKWAIQLLGTCRIGIRFPNFAMDQFNAGEPWDVTTVGDQTVDGGHDVPLVWYGGDDFICITWGKEQHVTPAFLAKYCDEAHGEVFADWVSAQGAATSGLNLDTLVSDLQSLEV